MKKLILVSLVALGWTGSSFAALIAHYDMEQTASPLVDQAGGQVAYAVDSGQLYSLSGPAGFGMAVGLNDNGSWQLSVEDSAEINLANDFTVAAWIYLDSSLLAAKTGLNSGLNRIIGDDVAWDGDGWSFGVWNDGRVRFTKNGVVDVDMGSPGTVAVDQWVHVAATISSADGTTLYVNGSPIGTHGNTTDIDTGTGRNGQMDPYGIGRSYGNGEAQWFAGRLDEVRVYDTVLSQDQIQALMVPEPSVLGLAALGMLALLGLRRRAGQ